VARRRDPGSAAQAQALFAQYYGSANLSEYAGSIARGTPSVPTT
jgi:hypothetical protein